MIQPKPCPYCASHHPPTSKQSEFAPTYWTVQCPECLLTSSRCEDQNAAISNWNALFSTQSPEIAQQIQHLRSLLTRTGGTLNYIEVWLQNFLDELENPEA